MKFSPLLSILQKTFTSSCNFISTCKYIKYKSQADIVKWICEHTEVSKIHMTPEIKLRLITPSCPLWKASIDECTLDDPYFAFYWPGGQVLSRYVLDNPDLFCDKLVLDVGSGCGASAIAARFCGAHVIANDIDPVACTAIRMNAELNGISNIAQVSDPMQIHMDALVPYHFCITTASLLGHLNPLWDTVLLGDMFYDESFAELLLEWAYNLSSPSRRVLIGDPGRTHYYDLLLSRKMKKVATYPLPPHCKQENNGMTEASVWTFDETTTIKPQKVE